MRWPFPFPRDYYSAAAGLNQESFAWSSLYAVSLWPLLVISIALLIASLLFRRLRQKLPELPEDATYLDAIQYMAQLASEPKAIDPTLDKVREITSRNHDTLSAADESSLKNVYYQLETYLTTQDPLLKITKEDLRTRLPEALRLGLEKGETREQRN